MLKLLSVTLFAFLSAQLNDSFASCDRVYESKISYNETAVSEVGSQLRSTALLYFFTNFELPMVGALGAQWVFAAVADSYKTAYAILNDSQAVVERRAIQTGGSTSIRALDHFTHIQSEDNFGAIRLLPLRKTARLIVRGNHEEAFCQGESLFTPVQIQKWVLNELEQGKSE